MSNFRLNTATLRSIKTATGIDAETISTSDVSVIDEAIAKRTGKTLEPSLSVGGLKPRGSIYLMFNRLFTPNEINKEISRIKP